MFDVLGPLTEQASTLRQSLDVTGRYSRLMAEGHEPELHEDCDRALIRLPALRGELASVRLTAEFAMTALLPMLRLFAGEQARPMRVDFAYRAPHYVAEYARVFGDAVHFEQAFTQMELPRAYLDETRVYRSPEIFALLETEAERSLGRLERDSSLRERIVSVLSRGAPRRLAMDEVARELGMSARSLRRRMQAEGVGFAALVQLSSTRAAKRMLERPGASIQETAHAMGFASSAAFHRAFKRWTGMTPKQYQDSF
jgi:AraC-like DNA-binding protein